MAPGVAAGQEREDDSGRDFPKTLVFDEPGIDDEVSLPTLTILPTRAGTETDADVELDKRLTTWVSLQINIGYTRLAEPTRNADGWQNSAATLKWILYADKAHEQLLSLSTTHEFGGTGALRVGAERSGSSTFALNYGQGFATLSGNGWIKPFAVTGSAGYLVPDSTRFGASQEAILSASLQYSFAVLSRSQPHLPLPGGMQPLIPIAEFTYTAPTSGHEAAHGFAAPGLIYAGEGFQLAAEALLPLTRDAGTHPGAIVQLNLSLALLGQAALAAPLF